MPEQENLEQKLEQRLREREKERERERRSFVKIKINWPPPKTCFLYGLFIGLLIGLLL